MELQATQGGSVINYLSESKKFTVWAITQRPTFLTRINSRWPFKVLDSKSNFWLEWRCMCCFCSNWFLGSWNCKESKHWITSEKMNGQCCSQVWHQTLYLEVEFHFYEENLFSTLHNINKITRGRIHVSHFLKKGEVEDYIRNINVSWFFSFSDSCISSFQSLLCILIFSQISDGIEFQLALKNKLLFSFLIWKILELGFWPFQINWQKNLYGLWIYYRSKNCRDLFQSTCQACYLVSPNFETVATHINKE